MTLNVIPNNNDAGYLEEPSIEGYKINFLQ